jgi:hypothetical protein
VTVTLLRPSYNADGSPTLRASGAAQSNDLGEYRLFWITPGKYYVMAGGDIERIYYDVQGGFDTSVRLGLNSVSDRYPPVFLPGVGDLSRATLVDLQEETELRGMNFTLSRQQFYSIRGHLIDATTGKPPADAGLSLTQRDFTGYGVMEPVDFDSSTGAFDVALPPGRYLLSASGPGTGSYPSYSTPGVPWTDREVVIRDGNADVELSLAVQPIITGQIALRGTLPAGKSLDQVRISLLPMDSLLPLRFQNPSATSDNTGKFRLAAEREGSYRVRVSGLPQGFYVKEARLNETDVLSDGSRFSASGTLSIVISEGAAQVDGHVINEQNKAVAGIEAVLIPDDHRNRAELFKRAVTDEQGQFSFTSVAPGNYRVFSWENIEPNSWFDESVVKKFEEKGKRVRAGESSHVTIEVRQIPEEAAP